MNKMFFRILAALLIVSTFSSFSAPVKINIDAPRAPIATVKFVGTWQLCKSDSTLNTDLGGQVGTYQLKVLTGESFTSLMVDSSKKIFMGTNSGSYTVKDDVYTETIEYCHPQMTRNLGVTNTFKVEFKNGFMIITGINNPYHEIWKKIKE